MISAPPSFSVARRWTALFNVALAIVAVVALAVMANYLGVRHFKRMFWAAGAPMKLSPRTLQVLGMLTNTIHVTVYFDSDPYGPDYPVYARVTGLLKEYQFASPRIEVERVDYLRDVAAATAVKAKYGLSQVSDKNLVIFESSLGRRVVSSTELSDYDLQAVIEQRSKEVRRTHFRGEMAFTSAIFSVATPRSFKAYFLRGHGEHSPDSTDQAIGYSEFAAILKGECNIPWDKLFLLGNNEVPADCSLLIIAGPTDPFSKEELAKLQRYLDQGGRLLVLFNFYSLGRPTGLEKLLLQYDVAVGENQVKDELRGSKSPDDMVLMCQGHHPIVTGLQNSMVYCFRPRTIRQAKTSSPKSGASKVEELLLTGPNSEIGTDAVRGRPRTFTPSGPVSLMVAVERGAVPGVSAERGTTRLAVLGESLFLKNDSIVSMANQDFAAHVINWLVDQNVLLSGVAPRPVKSYRLTMTQGQLAATRWLLLVGLPGGVLLVGALVWWRRRS